MSWEQATCHAQKQVRDLIQHLLVENLPLLMDTVSPPGVFGLVGDAPLR